MFSFFEPERKRSSRRSVEPDEVFKRLDDLDEPNRIQQLETELERVGKAFEDYIATTEGLEVDVKKELREMRKSNAAMYERTPLSRAMIS